MYANPLSHQDRIKAEAFVRRAILLPWRAGAQGPDAYDCWGLARAAQRELAGRDLPIVNADPADLRAVVRIIASHPLHQEWSEQPTPAHLDVVTMAHHKHPSHIGVYLALDGGGILHAVEQFDRAGNTAPNKPGITFDTIAALKLQTFTRFQFMRHRGETV